VTDSINTLKSESKDVATRDLEKIVKNKWASNPPLGGRCKFAVIGGAASSSTLKDWIFSVLNCVVIDGYGTTETGGLSGNETNLSGADLQLIDCPELGYLTTDKPYPRGEVVARTKRTTPGYYADEEATAERFVSIPMSASGGNGEGARCLKFFRTGDVGECVNGNIRIIDRASSVFKLAQGVFVAPTPLEQLFSTSEWVSQIYIHGEPSLHAVIAVVVPTKLFTQSISTSNEPKDGDNKINNNETIWSELNTSHNVNKMLSELRRIGTYAKLKPWEIPQHVVLDPEEWTNWNGLLSTIGKPARGAIKQKYTSSIKDYVQSVSSSSSLSSSVSTESSEEGHNSSALENLSSLCLGLQQLLSQTIPRELLMHTTVENSLMEIGVDSMSLARLSSGIQERFGISLPLATLIKLPSLMALQAALFGANISELLVSDSNKTLASSSIDWMEEVRTTLEPLLLASDSAGRTSDFKNERGRSRILLTGATGFFGAFLLHELLSNEHYKNQRISCLVRGKDKEDARKRLSQNMSYYGLYNIDNSNDRVEVLVGDLGEPDFGLDAADWDRLLNGDSEDSLESDAGNSCRGVSMVIHNGAIVNSVMPYQSLKASNVIGTQTVLRLSYLTGCVSTPLVLCYRFVLVQLCM